MKIYLIRHAAAVSEGAGIADGYRFLTLEGRQKCREVGRVLRDHGVAFDAVVTSPLVRAVQTAELIADRVDYLGAVESHTAFAPGSHPRVTAEEILSRGASVAVIGHAPYLSELAGFIVGRPGFAPFRKTQVCLFEDRQPVWSLHPEALQFQDLHTG